MRRLRLYAETSVFGGCFDEEFAEDSKLLFEEIRRGRFVLVVSDVTVRELRRAPPEVRAILSAVPEPNLSRIGPRMEISNLRDEYIRANVVRSASLLDAEHIAAASVARADLIVSWNFKHIVHFEKIRGYHAVNLLNGYNAIPIYSPREVVQR
jgi:hypothetical protein